jgi:peptide/nickel transport system permease protein
VPLARPVAERRTARVSFMTRANPAGTVARRMGGSLWTFLVRRLLSVVAVVFMVTAVTWLCFRLLRPEFFAGDGRHVLVQLGDYLQRVFLHLDLGRSWEQPQPEVMDIVRAGLPADLWLLGGGLVFGIAAGVAAGGYVASNPRSAAARAIETVAMVFLCAPVYVVGLSLLLLFGAGIAVSGIGVVPVKYVPFEEDPLAWAGSLIVPWIVLGLPLAAVCERMTNSSMREVMHEEFVRTARAKGLSRAEVLRRHAMPAALAPVFTLAGVTVPVMVTNMVLVELTFSIPGVFQNVRESMADADFPVIQGTVIAAAVLVAVATVVVDIALAWLDPRTRAATATP